jgi:hypothetical protein
MFRRHKLLLVLLAFGTIGGYASAFAHGSCGVNRRAAFERHVASVCLDAARDAAIK